jgi:hypothetical protein
MRTCALPLFLFACGCSSSPAEPTPSGGVLAGQIELLINARGNGAVAQLFVKPNEHGGPYLEIAGGDQLLFAEDGGLDVPLVRDTNPWDGIGETYDGQAETAGVNFTVTLARAGGERYSSALALPPAFALTVPQVPAPRSQDIPVVWDNLGTGYGVAITISGPCISTLSRQLEQDTGTYTIQPADLFVSAGTADCDLEVEIDRSNAAVSYAPELSPPTWQPALEQIRTAIIHTVP